MKWARVIATVILGAGLCVRIVFAAGNDLLQLESRLMRVHINPATGKWCLWDKESNVRWPTEGTADPGTAHGLDQPFQPKSISDTTVFLANSAGAGVIFELVDDGHSLTIRYEGEEIGAIRVLEDALAVTDTEGGYVIVPCREGLLIPADSGVAFERRFGTSDYEGCHMNMIGLQKSGSALIASWEDVYVEPTVLSQVQPNQTPGQRLTARFQLRRSARMIRLTPLGNGNWNTIAAAYRKLAEKKGSAIPISGKIRRNNHTQLLLGASNVKLWTCLARRMNEESTAEESVAVRWTFDEAAAIAEHLHNDLGIDRCLFMLGGWTEGGYDCRHPDNLPANSECGGNEALANAIQRIQNLNYVACLHDNYQDMYRDAKSWNPELIQKHPDGSLVQGGRWLGGRAYIVCASQQLDLAMRPQNLPAIQKLFGPWSYFIDTTYAAGPQECADPKHPIDGNADIAWKIRLSDAARNLFGLFGSECGREWAIPHSDFFEGLVGVSGKYYHTFDPASMGAIVIPFWEMVYHDCEICYGKYGYAAEQAAEYVAHHVLCARPLHYHSIPDHRYWIDFTPVSDPSVPERSCFTRTDSGWAGGLHPMDAFIKNTHEVLSPLHLETGHDRLSCLEFLTPDKTVRKATYDQSKNSIDTIVNFGQNDATIKCHLGGTVLLPPWGFVIESQRLAAFYAKSWNGIEYPEGALFTLRTVDGENISDAKRLRIFHGFGAKKIRVTGKEFEVEREAIVKVR
ncbi:MAG: hypothetical protein JW829_00045 [Pirellulales bacterium]|nr:hypothetical protein [Pirellulales bacterium]